MPVFLALVTLYLAWGSSYLAIRIGVHDVPPLLFCAQRFLIAAPLLFVFAWSRGERLPGTGRDWLILMLTAAVMLVLGSALVAWAVQWVPSGQAALIIASSALWMALFGSWGARGEPINLPTWLGLGAGMLGVGLVVTAARTSGIASPFAYLGLLLAAIGWSAGSVGLRRFPVSCGPMMTATLHMAIGGLLLWPASWLLGEPAPAWTAPALAALLYLAVFGTFIAYGIYYWLLQHATPVLVSTYAYVAPVIAVLLGVLLLDEPITPTQLAGSALVLLSVLIVTRPRRSAR